MYGTASGSVRHGDTGGSVKRQSGLGRDPSVRGGVRTVAPVAAAHQPTRKPRRSDAQT